MQAGSGMRQNAFLHIVGCRVAGATLGKPYAVEFTSAIFPKT
jgi:hypothetical protein